MAEPRPAPEGADVGGMRSTADAGLGRATQRSTERAESHPIGPASTGNASGGAEVAAPRSGRQGRARVRAGNDRGDRRPRRGRHAPTRRPTPAARARRRADRAGARQRAGGIDDDEDEWRHEPRAPVDESPLKSFGKSIGDDVHRLGRRPDACEASALTPTPGRSALSSRPRQGRPLRATAPELRR